MSLHISGLNVRYRTRILHDISLQIADGEVLAIIGPSGSGKTTFLHAIAGLTQIETGKISVNGINITQLRTDRRRVGLAFQNPALFDMTVKENIEFGIDDPDIPALRRAQLADITMSALNIIDLAQRHVRTLSGGQAQRVALARTLAAEPQILLLDEPMAHLEAAVQQNIHADLLAQIKRHQIPTIYVTHDLADACAVADRIAVMDQGQIVQIGTAEELFFRPNSPVVAQMLGVANIFSVQAEKAHMHWAKKLISAYKMAQK
ncbi:ABC transporter ATP-binding protein [Arcanobacterium hippocoleae]|uniref:ABC transporter ATP-binding protein n=1 Tax=Arcanobacterium hippocoleae TaxID=149017 RepID=UPI0033405AA0